MKERQRREEVTDEIRFEVKKRDNFTCVYCGFNKRNAGENWGILNWLEIDHILAIANGGTHGPENLVVCCYKCNIGKSSIPLWKRLIPLKQFWNKRVKLERMVLKKMKQLAEIQEEIREIKGGKYQWMKY
jgi:5-methylcytosine-specific restriction endonuclease McrA